MDLASVNDYCQVTVVKAGVGQRQPLQRSAWKICKGLDETLVGFNSRDAGRTHV